MSDGFWWVIGTGEAVRCWTRADARRTTRRMEADGKSVTLRNDVKPGEMYGLNIRTAGWEPR